jgi:DNA-binding transcriptional regulator YdaS (Cro superfamily)
LRNCQSEGKCAFLPARPVFSGDPGDNFGDVRPDFEFYFDLVRKRTYSREPSPVLINCEAHALAPLNRFVRRGTKSLDDVVDPWMCGHVESVAATRAGRAVGCEVFVCLAAVSAQPRWVDPISDTWGSYVWLPPTTKVPVHEGIAALLTERYGIEIDLAPGWTSRYELRLEQTARQKVTAKQAEIDRLTDERKYLRAEAATVSAYKDALLSGTDEGVEDAAHWALTTLGATVVRQAMQQDDGRFVDPYGRKFVIEAKGLTGAVKREAVRQAVDWRNHAASENFDGKAVVVATTDRRNDPEKRGDAFTGDAIAVATREGVCLLTSVQLLGALDEDAKGSLDRQTLWDAVINTDGACGLPGILPQAPSR